VKPKNSVRRYALVVLISALMLLSVSCATTPAAPPVSLALDWPVAPDPTGQVCMLPAEATVRVAGESWRLPTDAIVMSLDYWLALVDYVISVRQVQALLGTVDGPVVIQGLPK